MRFSRPCSGTGGQNALRLPSLLATMVAASTLLTACNNLRSVVEVNIGEPVPQDAECYPRPTDQQRASIREHVPRETPAAHYLANLAEYGDRTGCNQEGQE